MYQIDYLMENKEEALRLELKTDIETIEKQALWAGIKPNMRVADIGCGIGKTTFYLQKLIQPNGSIVGVDGSKERIFFAEEHYNGKGIAFKCKDIREPLDELGMFDFIWVRFVLEYYRSYSYDIVKNISRILKPGGILCLIDLDYNCLTHFGLSNKLEKTISEIMHTLEKNADFDPYAGRKLYSFFYDLEYQEINVNITPHHLIFGKLEEKDAFNWNKKLEVAAINSGYSFEEYEGGCKEFIEESIKFFTAPRRFTYTPAISCRGRKPVTQISTHA